MNTLHEDEQDKTWEELGESLSALDAAVKERDRLREEVQLLRELRNAVLSVCVILSDDTPEKPSMIYGHPTRDEWFALCLAARNSLYPKLESTTCNHDFTVYEENLGKPGEFGVYCQHCGILGKTEQGNK